MHIRNLLIVDNNVSNNVLISRVLRSIQEIGHIETKANGWDALVYLAGCQEESCFPELIFVELKMPEMDGFAFIENYQKRFGIYFPHTRLIAVAETFTEVDKEKVLSHHAVAGYVNKPLVRSKLAHILENL